MAGEDFKDFLISIGFQTDVAGAQKATATHAKVEADITKAAAEGAAKREAIEDKAGDLRITFAQAVSRLLQIEEEKLSDSRAKIRKDDAARDEAAALAAVKRQRDRRDEAIKSAGKFALNIVSLATKAITAMEGMALGVFVAADKAAASMEKLHYAASWAGTTPKGLNAFTYAAQQLGESVGEAEADLSKFGKTLKTIPAMEGVLKNANIQTRDAAGNWRDMADLATEYMDTLKNLPKLQREAKGGILGLGENTLRVGTDARFAGLEQQYKGDQAAVGNDDDANGDRGAAFEQKSRRLKSMAGGIYNRVMGGAMDTLMPQLDKLQTWMADHGDQVAKTLERIVKDIIAFANAVLDDLSKIDWDSVLTKVEDFGKKVDDLTKSLTGESGATVAIVALGAAITSKLLGPLGKSVRLLRALTAIPVPAWFLAAMGLSAAAQWQGAKDTAKTLGSDDPTKNDVVVDPESGMATKVGPGEGNQGTGPNTGFNRKTGFMPWIKSMLGLDTAEDRRVKDAILQTAESTKKLVEKAGGIGGDGDGGGGSGGGVPNMRYGRGPGGAFRGTPGSSLASGGEGGTASWRNNNPGNISAGKFAREHGADGSNGRWAHFPDYATGRKAQEDLWFNSDLYKGKTLAGAVTQWSPPNENDTAGLIRRYAAATGVDPSTPLSRFTPEQRAKLLDAQQAAEGWRAGKRTNTVSSAASTAAVAGDSPEVAEARRYLAQTATGAAAQRSDSIVNLNPAFALAAAKAIKQARAEGINAGIFSGYRKPTQTGSNYDANGLSSHSYGIASDFSGIGTAGSATARRFDEIARAAGLGGYGPFNRREFNHKELGLHLEKDLARLARMRATLGPDGYMRDPKATWAASGYVLPAGAKETFPQVAKAPPSPLASRTLGGFIHEGGGYAMKPQGEPLKVEVTKADQLAEIAKRASEHADATKIVARALAARAFGGNPLMPHTRHPIGVTPAMHVSMDQSRRRGDVTLNNSPTYHIHGGDTRTAMDHARASATRGGADLLRHGQSMET